MGVNCKSGATKNTLRHYECSSELVPLPICRPSRPQQRVAPNGPRPDVKERLMDKIDPALVRLIAERIDSVAHLELILLVRRNAGEHVTAADAARSFGLSVEMARNLLDDLCRDGFA